MNRLEGEFTLFADSRCELAENPLWNAQEQKLYWKDVQFFDKQLYRKDYDVNCQADSFECFSLQGIGMIGGFTFTQDRALYLFAQHGRVWHWKPGRKPVQVAALPGATEKTLFNDVITDPAGRVYCGVLADDFFDESKRGDHGSLWRLDTDGSFHCLEPKTGKTPNGMGFSSDQKYFYFAESDEGVVYRYDYDLPSGAITNKTTLIKRPVCDGMTVDAEGCLWVAHAWGGPLARYSQDGKLLSEFRLPGKSIGSVTFGGKDYKTIFVTTFDYPKGCDQSPGAGGIFRCEQNIQGLPEFMASINSLGIKPHRSSYGNIVNEK